MMILTKSRHKFVLLTILIALSGGRASALNRFECLRGLISVTEQASLQDKRKGVDKPFFEGDYLVFPEVTRKRLAGFFVYKGTKAWHYNAVERLKNNNAKHQFSINSAPFKDTSLYQMVTQPDGFRTLTLLYLPGLLGEDSLVSAPVALGSTVLPVIGAIGAKNRLPKAVYNNLANSSEDEIKAWIYPKLRRKPANFRDVTVRRTMIRLASKGDTKGERLWEPLNAELGLRREWIQTHNLDTASFQKFSQLLEGPCRED
jgi:hypothetical protein